MSGKCAPGFHRLRLHRFAFNLTETTRTLNRLVTIATRCRVTICIKTMDADRSRRIFGCSVTHQYRSDSGVYYSVHCTIPGAQMATLVSTDHRGNRRGTICTKTMTLIDPAESTVIKNHTASSRVLSTPSLCRDPNTHPRPPSRPIRLGVRMGRGKVFFSSGDDAC